MRLLVLPRYGALGASSRLRTNQYLPSLQAAGIETCVSPLLSDDYLRGLYTGRTPLASVIRGYWTRIARIIGVHAFDLIWVEKEFLPWMPAWFALAMLHARCKIVVDYDDAIFHRYDQHRSPLVRRVLGGSIDSVMRRADLVVCGNDYLAARAVHAGARRVEQLPTVIDLERYPRSAPRPTDPVITIGWIGSPSTARYLGMLTAAIEEVASRHPIRCIAVGARADQVAGTRFEAQEWSAETEVAKLGSFDIGVMPLPDGPWERGKCGYKLIQYMACGVPVVASPVGVNTQIVVPGENGELAGSDRQWGAALESLVGDVDLRRRMGEAGRRRVESWYALQVQAPRLLRMLRSVAHGDDR